MPRVEPLTPPKNTEKPKKSLKISPILVKITGKPDVKHPHKREKSNAAWYVANKDKAINSSKARYKSLTESEKCLRRWKGEAKPSYPQPGSKSALVPRKMALAKAYCAFSDTDEVLRIYIACAVMNELDLGKFVVDHMVPLQARTCSGLHVHTNLQVISEAENKAKGWSIWPDMWPVTYASLPLLMALQAQGD